jgi:hypothetical protein
MPNPKKYKNRYVTTLPFEKEYFERLNQLLPRGVSIADEINKFIEERVRDLEAEKNRDASIAVDASPIRPMYYNPSNNTETLDKYISFHEDREKRVKQLWDKDSIRLYEISEQLDLIQEEISTIRWRRYKQSIPKKTINMKLIPFIEQTDYGPKK